MLLRCIRFLIRRVGELLIRHPVQGEFQCSGRVLVDRVCELLVREKVRGVHECTPCGNLVDRVGELLRRHGSSRPFHGSPRVVLDGLCELLGRQAVQRVRQCHLGYLSKKLTKAARASLDDTLAMIPVGMPNSCSVTPVTRVGEVIPALLDLSTSRATATAEYLTNRGLPCSVARTPAATEAVTYRARRAIVAITYGH